jgi:hypothetical protein
MSGRGVRGGPRAERIRRTRRLPELFALLTNSIAPGNGNSDASDWRHVSRRPDYELRGLSRAIRQARASLGPRPPPAVCRSPYRAAVRLGVRSLRAVNRGSDQRAAHLCRPQVDDRGVHRGHRHRSADRLGRGTVVGGRRMVDLFPDWHGERFPLFAFHPSRKHPPAKVRAFVGFCAEIVQEL